MGMKLFGRLSFDDISLTVVGLVACGTVMLALPFTCTSGRVGDHRVALTVWTQFESPSDIHLFSKQLRDFERQRPGIDVKVEQVGASRRNQKYLAAMQADASADLIMLHWRDIPQFAAKDMLLPLGPFYEGDEEFDIDDFFQQGLAAFKFRQQQVALPEKGSTQLLFYNKTLFDRAGQAYPDDAWTFDDVVDAARQIIASTPEGESPPIGLIPLDAAPWVWSSGGQFANDELSELHFTDPATIDAVNFIWRLRNEWCVTSRNLTAQGVDAAEVDVFESGNIAMAVGGPWKFSNYEGITSFEWDIALFPKGPAGRRTRHAAMGFAIWSGSDHPDEAWLLMRHMLGQEALGERKGKGYNDIPARRSVALGEFANQESRFDLSVLLRSIDDEYAEVKVLPQEESWPQIERFFYRELDLAMLGRKTPEEAMHAAEAKAELFLAQERHRPGVIDVLVMIGVPIVIIAAGLSYKRGVGR